MRVISGLSMAALFLLSGILASAAEAETSAPGEMALIPAGTFIMGSPTTEAERYEDESQHEVSLSGFLIGRHEVTVAEFRAFVKATGYKTTAELNGGARVKNPDGWEKREDASWTNPYIEQSDDDPVVDVSWFDSLMYCNWRSLEEGLDPIYSIEGTSVSCNLASNGYRLPTEAEWEYACRAGTTRATAFGDSLSPRQANISCNYPFDPGKLATESCYSNTRPVGSYPPNAWGLWDMHGNVSEWCWDRYGPYPEAPERNPVGVMSGPFRVLRGGNWYSPDSENRSAARSSGSPAVALSCVGFRIVRNAP